MDDDFGSWVYSRRTKQGLSRTELANQVGVSQEYIRLIENGRKPSLEVRLALTSVLDEVLPLNEIIYNNLNFGQKTRREFANELAEKIFEHGFRHTTTTS